MSAPRLHPFWRLFWCALAVLLVTLVAAGVGTKVVVTLNPQLLSSNLSIDQLKDRLVHDYGLALTLVAYPLALLVLWLFRTQVDKRSWSSLGFVRPRAFPNFARGALTAFLTLSVLFSLLWLSGALRYNGLSSEVIARGLTGSLLALGGFFVAFLLVGFMEETAFRGYALHNLSPWLGWRSAVAIQAIVFALIHLGNGGADRNALLSALGALPSLALIAVFFAVSYRKTGSLWFPIGFHTMWNFCLGCVFSQPVSSIQTFRLFDVQQTGAGLLSGGKFGAEGSFFLIPLVLALIYFLSLAPDHPRALANLNPTKQPVEPQDVPLVAATEPEIEPAEERENRYSARFGSAQGFDSGMLSELKQMQDAREEAERARLETQRLARRAEDAREAEVRRAQIAAQEHVAAVEETKAPVVVVSEAEAPVSVETEATQTPIAVATEKQAEVAVSTESVEPQTQVAPVRPSLEPRRPSLESRRPSLEPRKPVAPPVDVAPEKTDAPPTSTPPTDAPPKKARPRW